jgi:hypothetical protein
MVPPQQADEAEGPSERDLQSLLDAARRAAAADHRRRSRSLGEQVAASGTLAGVLVDLGERAVALRLTVRGGRAVRGRVVAVGADVVIVAPSDGPGRAVVAVGAIDGVHVGGDVVEGVATVTGDRPPTSIRSLGSVLADLVGTAAGTTVAIGTMDGRQVDGRLVSVGDDVATVRSGHGGVAYVPLRAVALVVTG